MTINALGHLYPMNTFARVLQDHGHTVTFFAFADSEQFLLDARLPCQVICSDLFPEGYVKRKLQALGKLDR